MASIENHQPLPPDAMTEGGEPGRPGRIETVEQFILCLSLLALVAAVCWGVLSRYVVTTPAAWVEEVSSIAFAWLIFIGAAEVHRRSMHISVDILTSLAPQSWQRAWSYVVEVIVLGFCLYVAWLGAEQALASRGGYTSILRIPLWVNYLGFTLGFLLMAFRSAQHLWRRLRREGGAR
jgi:TRAP-type C4-dicarboxylate transport system permease small subunit